MKGLIKRVMRGCGFDLVRYPQAEREEGILKRLLSELGITAVIDIGANVGQFGGSLFTHGFAGAIASFEPLSAAHAQLEQVARRHRRWIVAPRCALGAAAGEATINVAANSVSSSLLAMEELHAAAAPRSAYVTTERVPVRRLDDALEGLLTSAESAALMLKIDTQGGEGAVLDGAERILPQVRVLELEMSLAPLYAGQALFTDLTARLERAGFVLGHVLPAFRDPRDGRLLQVDGIFVRARVDQRPTPG